MKKSPIIKDGIAIVKPINEATRKGNVEKSSNPSIANPRSFLKVYLTSYQQNRHYKK